MEQKTAEILVQHHGRCGGFEFTKSVVMQDDQTDERFYQYRCLTCQETIRELVPMVTFENQSESATMAA